MTTTNYRLFCAFVIQSVNTYSSMSGKTHLPHRPHNLKRSQGLEAAKDEGELTSIWEGLSHWTLNLY